MSKKIILVHGRSYKPNKTVLKKNWVEAIQYGIERDHGVDAANKFKNTKVEMAYYGDLSNEFLSKNGNGLWTEEKEKADIQDRKAALTALKAYGTKEFTKRNYHKVRDLGDVVKEGLMDLLSGPLSLFGVGDNLAGMFAPDMKQYWNPDAEFGSEVRWCLTKHLVKSVKANNEVLLIAHSLGTIVSYDVLWKISHYSEYKELRKKNYKNITLLTLGSPLGDENVKNQLKGDNASGIRHYPQNIKNWINLAAEDDYIAHDPTVANDFRKMKQFGGNPKITDHKIYNMAIRDGNTNPHHGAGYLIHPKCSQAVVSWLG